MSCAELVELVTAYLDDALDGVTRRRFEEHLAECPGCDRYLDQFRQTIRHLGSLPVHTLPAEARDTLLTAFREWGSKGDQTDRRT